MRASLVDRSARERSGRRAEWLARWFLALKGYRCLARRLRTPAGEIDLIVARGRTLVFVEVKLRRTLDEACAALTPMARLRLARAARAASARFSGPGWADRRFDVVALAPGRWPRHIIDALPAGDMA